MVFGVNGMGEITMRMEQLEYFLAVAESGSLNATAQQFFISQQGLSDSLKRLEKELDVVLINRSKTGVSLTNAGEQLVPYAKEILKKNSDFMNKVKAIQSIAQTDKKDDLFILTVPFLENTLIPDLIDLSVGHMPPIKVTYSEKDIEEMLPLLQSGKAHAALCLLVKRDIEHFRAALPEHVHMYKLFDDEMYVSCSVNHPLAGKKFCTNADIKKYSLVNFNTKYWQEATLDDWIVEATTNNPVLQFKMMTQHSMLAISSKVFAKNLFPQEEIVSIPHKPPHMAGYFILISMKTLSEVMKEYLTLLAEQCKKISGQYPEYMYQQEKP